MSENESKETARVMELMEKVRRERALDFTGYKTTSFGRRVTRRVEATNCPDIESYMKLLDSRPDEYAKLIDCILINVTEFFRDAEAWDVVRSEVIPRIMEDKRPGDQVRFWSAGCAAGQEAYSLAMALAETVGPRLSEYDVRIYATDMDEDALAAARRGSYSDDEVGSVPEEMREKYLTRNSRWTVNRDIRKLVIFGRHNLVTDAPISHVDMISCRNVLIYMAVDLQNRILSKFHYGLQPNGYLFLGKSESLLSASRIFGPANERWRIFRKEAALGAAGRTIIEQQTVGQAVEVGGAEYQIVSLFNESVLRHSPSGIIAIDDCGIIRVINPAAERIWQVRADDLLGKPLVDAPVPVALREAMPKISQARSQRSEVRIEEMDLSAEFGRPLHVSLIVDPMYDVRGNAFGTVFVAENITNQVNLRAELETVNEQLQATNEELETTNEELQSTNEELETTNEELQSTNEELETTNEELQSTNEELSTTNDELGVRTNELNTLSFYHSAVLDSIVLPTIVLNEDNIVQVWNPAAEGFYGLRGEDIHGRSIFEVDLAVRATRLRERLARMRETGRPYRSRPISYRSSAGDTRQAVIEFKPLIDAQKVYRGLVITAGDAQFGALEPAAKR